MDPMEAIRATFFEECAELLEALEGGLLALHAGHQDDDTINAVFRAVHSIKGGAGAFGLGDLVAYAHAFETALDALRTGRLAPSPATVAVFLRASDRLGDVVAVARSGEATAPVDTDDLTRLVAGTDADVPADRSGAFVPVPRAPEDPQNAAPATGVDRTRPRKRAWIIDFEPLPDLLVSGNEPLFLFRALEVMGTLEVQAIDADLASLAEMDVHLPRLRWRIRLVPSAPDLTETEIEAVFEFAVDLCVLDIRLDRDDAVETDLGPFEDVDPPQVVVPQTDPPPPDCATIMPVFAPQPAGRSWAVSARRGDAQPGKPLPTTIRVDLDRVDRLVNLVGELVISQSMLVQGLSRERLDREPEFVATLDGLQQLTRDMQDSVMAIRAQPVKSLFQRMTRIVREVAQLTGKEVVLEMAGEATEIDKTVVERLAEPLTHLIRNAIDHGLEGPADRARAGKAGMGIVRLDARQQSDRVIIEVADDGRGIDRARILARAVGRGLVPESKTLTEEEIDRLIFLPGFSTSNSVSELSGRGVGMDVVHQAIRGLNGTISVASEPGTGCTVTISLPLTLAILDGMIVRSGRQRMVVPLSAILETQVHDGVRVETVGPGRPIVRLHERYVPLIDLAAGMGFPSDTLGVDDEETALLFVQPDDGKAFALRVDAIEAQRQVVVKGLGTNFGHVPCVSAATILGDGQVALIVDPAGIARMAGLHRAAWAARLEEAETA